MKPDALGPYVRGRAAAYGAQPKVIAAKSGVHETSISKFYGGSKNLSPEQLVHLCEAIGEIKAEQRLRDQHQI